MPYSVFLGAHEIAHGNVSETEFLNQLGTLGSFARSGATYYTKDDDDEAMRCLPRTKVILGLSRSVLMSFF